MKKKITYIGGVILAAVLPLLGYTQFLDVEEIGFIYTVTCDGDLGKLQAALDSFPDGTAVRITFSRDGVEIPNSPTMRLMGDADSAWNSGDWLPLHKRDGVWHEMTRYLKP